MSLEMKSPLLVDAAATLLAEGAPRAAVTMLRAAWHDDLPPDERIPFYYVWIQALSAADEPERALELAERACAEHPTSAMLHEAWGFAALAAGRTEWAQRALERALAFGAGASTHVLLGELFAATRRKRRALEAFDAAWNAPDAEADVLRRAALGAGAVLRALGRLEAAVERYDALLERMPWDADALLDRAICLSELGDLATACAGFDRAIVAAPDHPAAHYNYAIALQRAGRFDDAVERMQAAHRLAPQEPLTCAVLGRWLVASGRRDSDRGIRLLHDAVFHLTARAEVADVDRDYARHTVEEIFEAFRHAGRWEEARWVLRTAADHDWLSPRLVTAVGARGDEPSVALLPYWAVIRVEAEAPPDHWPCGARGYTTDLAVFARDPDEARAHALSFLRTLEGDAPLSVDVEILTAEDAAESGRHLRIDPDAPVAGGVTDVLAKPTYFGSRR